jgi:hypothetical protein
MSFLNPLESSILTKVFEGKMAAKARDGHKIKVKIRKRDHVMVIIADRDRGLMTRVLSRSEVECYVALARSGVPSTPRSLLVTVITNTPTLRAILVKDAHEGNIPDWYGPPRVVRRGRQTHVERADPHRVTLQADRRRFKTLCSVP